MGDMLTDISSHGEAVRTDTICEAERTGSLDTAADILDVGLDLRAELRIERSKVLASENLERGDDTLADELLGGLDRPFLGDLHLQRALAEAEGEHLGDVLLHL